MDEERKIEDAFHSLCSYLDMDTDVDVYDTLVDDPDIYGINLDGSNDSDAMDLVSEGIEIGKRIGEREYHWAYDDGIGWLLVGTVDEILAKFQRIRDENPAKPPPEKPNDFQI